MPEAEVWYPGPISDSLMLVMLNILTSLVFRRAVKRSAFKVSHVFAAIVVRKEAKELLPSAGATLPLHAKSSPYCIHN